MPGARHTIAVTIVYRAYGDRYGRLPCIRRLLMPAMRSRITRITVHPRLGRGGAVDTESPFLGAVSYRRYPKSPRGAVVPSEPKSSAYSASWKGGKMLPLVGRTGESAFANRGKISPIDPLTAFYKETCVFNLWKNANFCRKRAIWSMKTILIFMLLSRLKIGGFRGIFAKFRGRSRIVTIIFFEIFLLKYFAKSKFSIIFAV